MAKDSCVNPECRDGVCPGVIASGGGPKGAPLIGSDGKMRPIGRWAWIRCRACRPDKDDPTAYEKRHRSDEEMSERARLANSKAPYVAPSKSPLEKIKSNTPTPEARTSPPDNSAQLAQLIDTVSKLSGQVANLLAENARLRSQGSPEPPEAPDPVPTQPRKRKSRQIAKPS